MAPNDSDSGLGTMRARAAMTVRKIAHPAKPARPTPRDVHPAFRLEENDLC